MIKINEPNEAIRGMYFMYLDSLTRKLISIIANRGSIRIKSRIIILEPLLLQSY